MIPGNPQISWEKKPWCPVDVQKNIYPSMGGWCGCLPRSNGLNVSARTFYYQDVLGTPFVSEKHGDQELNFQDEHMCKVALVLCYVWGHRKHPAPFGLITAHPCLPIVFIAFWISIYLGNCLLYPVLSNDTYPTGRSVLVLIHLLADMFTKCFLFL